MKYRVIDNHTGQWRDGTTADLTEGIVYVFAIIGFLATIAWVSTW